MWLFFLICAVLYAAGSRFNARARARKQQHKTAVWQRNHRRSTEAKAARWQQRKEPDSDASTRQSYLADRQITLNPALGLSELDSDLHDELEAVEFVRTQPLIHWALGLAIYAHTSTYLHTLAKVSLQNGDHWEAMMCLWLKCEYKARFTAWCMLVPPASTEPEVSATLEEELGKIQELVQELVDASDAGENLPALPREAEWVLGHGEASPFAPLEPNELEGSPVVLPQAAKPKKNMPYHGKDGKWSWKRYWAAKDAQKKRRLPKPDPL